MNNLQNNYCEECDYKYLEINFKNYKQENEKKKENNYQIKKSKFIPINLNSLPKQSCKLCHEINHKINNCPLLSNNITLSQIYIKKNISCLTKKIFKKSILKKNYKLSDNFDICYHFSNFNIHSNKNKKVSFNLSTTH